MCCFSVIVDSMAKLRVTRTNRGREWLRSTNFYLSTKSRGWNGGHFRFQIHTSMTCGGWNFDLANYDAFISTDSRASDGFTIDIELENVHSWKIVRHCMRMHRFHEPHIATMQCPLRMSCVATASSLSINWLCHVVMKPRCEASAANARRYSEVCDLFRFFCHNIQFCTTKIKMRK